MLAAAALAAALLACGGGEPPAPTADPATRRSLASGSVVGFTSRFGAHAWRGIPFARPPVGPLRWRAPQPPEPWEGALEALEFGAACPQFAGPMGARDGTAEGEPGGDEDCLRLHVYAPPFAPDEVPGAGERLPVLFWIHGGGNTIGEAATFEGSRIALAGRAVVVATNYRLGVFGWFRHEALDGPDASADDRSGNYGTLDLVRSLEWVKQNIAAFGGDPERVTVFGESAGGSNVFSLLLTPRARGLFQRAIVQSGGLRTTSLAEARQPADAVPPGHDRSSAEVAARLWVDAGRAEGRAAALEALAGAPPAEVGAFLRGRSTAQVMSVFEGNRLGGMYHTPRLIADGAVLPAGDPLEVLAAAAAAHPVPVILGTNRDENRLFAMFASDFMTRLGGIPLWLNDPRRYELETGYQSLMWKATGADEPAAVLRPVLGERVFVYRFDWDEENEFLWLDLPRWLGAGHAVEIPFVFGHLDLGFASRLLFDPAKRPAAEELSARMMSYWAAFAARGDPGRGLEGDLPVWRAWAPAAAPSERFLVFDSEADGGLRMESDAVNRHGVVERLLSDDRFEDAEERCRILAAFVRWGETLTPDGYRSAGAGLCRDYPLQDWVAGG
ncbi:MAG: carboxylesterase/lipase family protein [Myxococcota bacterium]